MTPAVIYLSRKMPPSRGRCNRPNRDASSAFRKSAVCTIATSGVPPEHGATFRSALLETDSEESVHLLIAVSTFLPCSPQFPAGITRPKRPRAQVPVSVFFRQGPSAAEWDARLNLRERQLVCKFHHGRKTDKTLF